MQIRIPETLTGQIRHLPPELKQQFRDGIRLLAQNVELGKPLREPLAGLRSLRLKKYRLVYQVETDAIVVVAFGPRSVVYEQVEAGTRKQPHP